MLYRLFYERLNWATLYRLGAYRQRVELLGCCSLMDSINCLVSASPTDQGFRTQCSGTQH